MDFLKLQEEAKRIEVKPYPWMKEKKFTLIKDIDQLRALVDAAIAAGKCALDLETEGLDNRISAERKSYHQIVGYCLSYDGEEGFYVPVGHQVLDASTSKGKKPHKANLSRLLVGEEIKRLCENCVTIYHNSGFDLEFLYGLGNEIDLEVDKHQMFEDTLILDYLRDSTYKRHGLKHLSEKFLNMEMLELEQLFPKNEKELDFSTLDPEEQSTLWYAGSDAICTYLLYLHLKYYGEEEQKQVYKIEKAMVPALRALERNRCLVDVDYANSLHKEILALIDDALEDIYVSLAKGLGLPISEVKHRYNVSSPQQLGKAILKLQEMNPNFNVDLEVTEKSGQVNTSFEAIERMAASAGSQFPFIQKVKVFRTLQKVEGTYVRPLIENLDPRDNTTRFSFNAHRVDTGRFSASKGKVGHGYSGINVQSMPACYNATNFEVRKINSRPVGMGDPNPTLSQKLLNAQREQGFLKRIYDGHFIIDNRGDQEYCVRASCEGCPFQDSCQHDEPEMKRWLSLEAAIRPAIIARPEHVLVAIDYGGLELRVAANLCKEEKWLKEYREGEGDLHKLTAQLIYGDDVINLPHDLYKLKRGNAKAANFAIIYGGGPSAVARATGVSLDEGKAALQNILKGLPTFNRWVKNTIAKAHQTKEVTTCIGRKIRLHDINHEEGFIRAKQERNAINGIVQGSATGDLIKYALSNVYFALKERGWLEKVKMILTIHDEIVYEIHVSILEEALAVISDKMMDFSTKLNWPVPLEIDIEIDTCWDTCWDWKKITGVQGQGKLAKQEMPNIIKDYITHKAGMWYKDELGNEMVYDGKSFIPKEQYLDIVIDPNQVTENKESPSMTPSEPEKPSQVPSETSIKPLGQEQGHIPESVLSRGTEPTNNNPALPPFEFKARIPLTKETCSGYLRRLKSVLEFCKPSGTHRITAVDSIGSPILPPNHSYKVDPEMFLLLADYEGL